MQMFVRTTSSMWWAVQLIKKMQTDQPCIGISALKTSSQLVNIAHFIRAFWLAVYSTGSLVPPLKLCRFSLQLITRSRGWSEAYISEHKRTATHLFCSACRYDIFVPSGQVSSLATSRGKAQFRPNYIHFGGLIFLQDTYVLLHPGRCCFSADSR